MTAPEYAGLADMEIHTAPGARITIRPFVLGPDGAPIAASPFHLVLTQPQAQQFARDLLAAADQSAEEAGAARH